MKTSQSDARSRARRHTRVRLQSRRPRLLAGAALALALASALNTPALAQAGAPATVVVTGNPLGSSLAQPSVVLTGNGLALRRAGTLAETLDGLPGVASGGFGPQASRPVIRGLDGDRVRLLDNGGASADASNLSFDHAVATDPLVVERLEVLRGPAALLYGGNATGGVVNALDNRIPREALSGLGGRATLRLGGAARETAAAAVLDGGAAGLNWHADVARRDSANLRTPSFTLPDGSRANQVANSDGRSEAAALGASWADAMGFAGAAVDTLRNHYGVTVDPAVRIRLQRSRVQMAAERRGLGGPFSSVSASASHSRYQHQEVEGDGTVGTTFSSRGHELRLQASQAPMAALGGTLGGVVGLQIERLGFSALGEEAFVPDTHTRSQALFMLQELALGAATVQAGARLERVAVHSAGDAPGAAEARFGPAAERRFSPRSLSVGLLAPLTAGWRASATLGSTQRAPAYYELFANGQHVATGTYEQGDPAQRLERSRHLELGLQWQQPGHSMRAALWHTRFANFIALDATGATVPVVDEGGNSSNLPVYRFSGVPARLQGLEIEGRHRLPSPTWMAGWQLDASASIDLVRADNRRSAEPLPRMAPLRLQAGLEARQGGWQLGVQVRHAARQDRVPARDLPTPAWTVADLWLAWQQRLGPANDALWTLKLNNLGDVLARNASALPSARALAPAGGRSLQAAVQLSF